MAPLYGHLSRDPWPAKNLIAPRRHLSAWIARMNQTGPAAREFFPDDVVPETLIPLIASLLSEMLPYLEEVARVAGPAMSRADRVPRFMDEVEFPMGEGRFRRPAMQYGLWMLQRMLDDWRAMPAADAQVVRVCLAKQDAGRLLDIQLPRLRRDGLQVAVDQA